MFSVEEMVVLLDDSSSSAPEAEGAAVMQNVDEEILVRYFCVEKERAELVAWSLKTCGERAKTIAGRVAKGLELKEKANAAAKKENWPVAVWVYLGALHHLDFSAKDAAALSPTVASGDDAEAAAAAEKKAADLKEQVTGATLLVLINLTLAFLKRGDAYNADRCATLGLWFEKRLDARDAGAQAKLLFRRATARFDVAAGRVKQPGAGAAGAGATGAGGGPERFASALSDAREAVELSVRVGGKADFASLQLVKDLTAAATAAGGSIEAAPPAPLPAPAQPAAKTAAKTAAAKPAATLAEAMADPGWMGKPKQRELEVRWEPFGDLWRRAMANAAEAAWGRVALKVGLLVLLQVAAKRLELPGHDRLTPCSAALAVLVLVAGPFFTEVRPYIRRACSWSRQEG